MVAWSKRTSLSHAQPSWREVKIGSRQGASERPESAQMMKQKQDDHADLYMKHRQDWDSAMCEFYSSTYLATLESQWRPASLVHYTPLITHLSQHTFHQKESKACTMPVKRFTTRVAWTRFERCLYTSEWGEDLDHTIDNDKKVLIQPHAPLRFSERARWSVCTTR